jgi:hypothetical protein
MCYLSIEKTSSRQNYYGVGGLKMMKKVKNVKTSARERKIDKMVESQAFDDSAWEDGVTISPKSKPTSIRLSPRTIQQAKFFARIHRQRGYQSWLKHIIEERISAEYTLYKHLKKQTERR